MRLLIKRGHSLINDLKFTEGPIYIGRQPQSQVFLPDRAVSRQHAVIFTGAGGNWLIRDLDSANRTIVNSKPISTLPLHEGDVIRIGDFAMEVHLESPGATAEVPPDSAADLGDTLIHAVESVPSIYGHLTSRKPEHVIHMAPARIHDMYELMKNLCRLEDQETLLTKLTQILLDQFEAYHIWAGFRETTEGPLTCHGGLSRGGEAVTMENLTGKSLIRQAMKNETFVLLPNLVDAAGSSDSSLASVEQMRSAMVAPIMAPAGAYGVIYMDNGCDQPSYSHLDLDYLTIVSTQVAALIEHIG
ncbi:MAG: FHA domain-containing protein [Sedimentisphaerales bacterium]|nr:FHA domain-containing protein [Sedimentisphaerales bacterium]